MHTPSNSARDGVSWNSMASGYLCNRLFEESLMVFGRMVERFSAVDAEALVGALTACAKIGVLNLGRRIHSLVVSGGAGMDSYLGSSLIGMKSKFGALDHAQKVFDEMPERNAVCWSAVISGCAQSNRFAKAIELFRRMQGEGVKPDEVAISSVLSSCAHSWVHWIKGGTSMLIVLTAMALLQWHKQQV